MTPETLAEIAAAVSRLGTDAAQGAALRSAFPPIHFTFCADDDVLHAEPVWAGAGFNLYLVDGTDHCLRLTSDFACATGILVATL